MYVTTQYFHILLSVIGTLLVSTAVFSTCGMGIIVFALAAFFSLPKQLITVYIGVILEEDGSGGETTKDKIISRVVLGVTILITIVAMWYIWRAIMGVKPKVIYARRKARYVHFFCKMF
ncbi:MAG TPA: hypothetical protein VGO47_07660 [Chlamydiales bacterium]|nr:hypothetical protein [Chlamydiales bacterium]